MIYIKYEGRFERFIGTLEGDDWKIVNAHFKDIEIKEYKDIHIKVQHQKITLEIGNEFGKSIKFDVDIGNIIRKYDYRTEMDVNYNSFQIGSNKRTVKIKEMPDTFFEDTKLYKFIENEMHFIDDFFNKIDKINLKKKEIDKDFE